MRKIRFPSFAGSRHGNDTPTAQGSLSARVFDILSRGDRQPRAEMRAACIAAHAADKPPADAAAALQTHGALFYVPGAAAPSPSEPPSRFKGALSLGGFHPADAIGETTTALWAAALTRVPSSRLILRDPTLVSAATRARILDELAARGVARERVDVIPAAPGRYADFERIDLYLDATPRAAGLRAVDALWMGVPVVTVAGDDGPARQTARCLKRIGLNAFVAEDADGFAACVANWGEDVEMLAALRRTLRDQVAASPLCDAGALATQVRDALRDTRKGTAAANVRRRVS